MSPLPTKQPGQKGLTLVEVLAAVTISTLVMIALAQMVDMALATQRSVKSENEVRERAQFALRRISAAVSGAQVKQLSGNPNDWLQPVKYSLAAGGVLTETDPAGVRTVATGVTAFSMTSPAVVTGRPVINVSITLDGAVTQSVTVRLGGPA